MEKSQIKHTQFRAWKSGKNWLFTSTALAVLGAGAAFGGQKAKADVSDVQNQIALNSLASDATPVSKTEAAAVAPTSSVSELSSAASSLATTIVSAASDQSLTSSEASALSAFSSGVSANPVLSSVFAAIGSATATSSGSAVMSSLTASLTASLGSATSSLGSLSTIFSAISNVASDSAALSAAISAAYNTSDMSSMVSAINAISEDATISNAVAAISAANAAGNSSLASSLASSFYTTTSEGAAILAIQSEFEQTATGKTITAAASSLQQEVSKVSATINSLVVTKSDGTYSFLGMTGDLADYLMSVVGATLGYAIGNLGGNVLTIPFALIIELLGNIGVAPLNMIGLTIPGWFGGIGSGYLTGVGWMATGAVFGLIGGTVGAWYGATNFFQGLSATDSNLMETLAGVGAAIGGDLVYGIGEVLNTLINHLWWLMIFPGAFLGVVPFAQFISVIIMAIGIPITVGAGNFISSLVSIIGAGIGALIGGAIGWICQALGLNIDIPTFTSALGWLLNVSGLGGLITQVIQPAATGSISVKNQTVANGTAFKPSSLLVSATDSNGSSVDLSTISYTGTVIPSHSGTYAVQFSFTDSDGSVVTQTALWTVQAKGTASAANIAEAVVTNKTTGSESLKVTSTTLAVGQAYRAASAFVSATDSEGNAVPASAITVTGTVVSSKAGVYPVVYSFTDPYTNDVVSQTVFVTVTAATKLVTA